jgi:hypothetical protein
MTTLVPETSDKIFRTARNSASKKEFLYAENIVKNRIQTLAVAHLTALTLLLWKRDMHGHGGLNPQRNVMSC